MIKNNCVSFNMQPINFCCDYHVEKSAVRFLIAKSFWGTYQRSLCVDCSIDWMNNKLNI